jgi:azurin
MKLKYLMTPVLFTLVSMQAMADDCSVTIDSTDAMKYDKSEIVIDKSCKEFTVNLTHSGKLAKNIMGHNVVITKAADARAVASDAIGAGLENNYVKPDDKRVIAFTDIIGGGEKTSVTFSVDKLTAGEDYTFFCSFPGHISLMQGSVSVGS